MEVGRKYTISYCWVAEWLRSLTSYLPLTSLMRGHASPQVLRFPDTKFSVFHRSVRYNCLDFPPSLSLLVTTWLLMS